MTNDHNGVASFATTVKLRLPLEITTASCKEKVLNQPQSAPVLSKSSPVQCTTRMSTEEDVEENDCRSPCAENQDENRDDSREHQQRRRHGARNQHRHKHFCKWIMDSFDLKEGDLVVDVAGGKGELAARLAVCHQLNVLLVDPRPANVIATFKSSVLPKLPKRHQERMRERCSENEAFLDQVFRERFRQLQVYFDDSTLHSNHELNVSLQTCKLIIGMHSDGATEFIVDAALKYNKPFVVVPCCVFPNLFNQRFLYINEKTIPVRSHAQFCQFLLEKDTRFTRATLPFEGRNVAILWNGDADAIVNELDVFAQDAASPMVL
jgi:hypothetical protein